MLSVMPLLVFKGQCPHVNCHVIITTCVHSSINNFVLGVFTVGSTHPKLMSQLPS